MTDIKEQLGQLDPLVEAIDKVVDVISIHGKENAYQGGFGLDEKTANQLKALDQKLISQYADPNDIPREALIEHFKTVYRLTGNDENLAEFVVDMMYASNAVAIIDSRLGK